MEDAAGIPAWSAAKRLRHDRDDSQPPGDLKFATSGMLLGYIHELVVLLHISFDVTESEVASQALPGVRSQAVVRKAFFPCSIMCDWVMTAYGDVCASTPLLTPSLCIKPHGQGPYHPHRSNQHHQSMVRARCRHPSLVSWTPCLM